MLTVNHHCIIIPYFVLTALFLPRALAKNVLRDAFWNIFDMLACPLGGRGNHR